MRGERLKKEHLDSAMEGVTYSGVRAVDVGLADHIWKGTLQETLADELEVEEKEIVMEDF